MPHLPRLPANTSSLPCCERDTVACLPSEHNPSCSLVFAPSPVPESSVTSREGHQSARRHIEMTICEYADEQRVPSVYPLATPSTHTWMVPLEVP